jgi:hypothetical protein
MTISDPRDHADDADLAEQGASLVEEEPLDVTTRDDVDEGDLLEQATSVPPDDDDYRG